MSANAARTVNILLVEDEEDAATAFRRALEAKDIANPLFHARDGAEALDMLRGVRGTNAVPRPRLVVLDLDMPRMNGIEFLDRVTKDEDLDDQVVLVLTDSQNAAEQEERVADFRRHVAGFVTKGNVGEAFIRAVRRHDPLYSLD